MPGRSRLGRTRGACLLLGFLLSEFFANAALASPEAPPAAGEDSLYLWMGVACFGLAGFLLLSRLLSNAAARRRRSSALRLFWSGHRSGGSRNLLRRSSRDALESRPVRLSRWEERTRAAEARADQAMAILRSELSPHLAQMMKDRLVWTLMAQRARLMSSNQASAEKAAALERRLMALQHQLTQQAEAYQARITELERELEDKGKVTRELLKFRVMLARQALDAMKIDGGGRRGV